jgi:hypothetical protein
MQAVSTLEHQQVSHAEVPRLCADDEARRAAPLHRAAVERHLQRARTHLVRVRVRVRLSARVRERARARARARDRARARAGQGHACTGSTSPTKASLIASSTRAPAASSIVARSRGCGRTWARAAAGWARAAADWARAAADWARAAADWARAAAGWARAVASWVPWGRAVMS